ncbi:protoporphyrinogen/coproporphyrinogen oxidase [Pleomorphovibrio marinus]|uniref:protoporphyrinogen/coproporphyrinogen oxidase n=1 Tax=Pleomorphovibrio marinus TaxID=2164132 RepID=UPI000E0B7E53|nr:NAD(P)/FAD-dependent oxidoreductase [Pleomorphovibrio marinus]
MTERRIYIVGAGVSGLVAAIELEKAGYSPVILEASDHIGGRIRTLTKDAYLLDVGFQVLLTSYPEAQLYLNYETLRLRKFQPGAVVFKPGDTFAIYDPLRNPFKLLNMAFSKVGTIFDKYRMFTLTKELKEKQLEAIFLEPEITTLQYLKIRGFSDKIIKYFFKPFFKGIFLEPYLETSSRMFEFVFKMFATGHAAIPENGMGQIPKQLAANLTQTTFRLNTKVTSIEKNVIRLESGDTLTADEIILTVPPHGILPNYTGAPVTYRKVTNMYFTLQKSFMARPMIGLVPDEKYLINNLLFLTDVSKEYAKDGRALLSVSIIKDVSNETNLVSQVALELETLSGILAEHFKHIETIQVDKALPVLNNIKYVLPAHHQQWNDHLFLAGDHLLNASINGAMAAGRKAAAALLSNLHQHPV